MKALIWVKSLTGNRDSDGNVSYVGELYVNRQLAARFACQDMDSEWPVFQVVNKDLMDLARAEHAGEHALERHVETLVAEEI